MVNEADDPLGDREHRDLYGAWFTLRQWGRRGACQKQTGILARKI